MSTEKKGIKEGPPIWVESLLTPAEHAECAKKYTTYVKGSKPVEMFSCEFRWRYRMGRGMTPEELKAFNKRLEGLAEMIEKLREKEEEARLAA